MTKLLELALMFAKLCAFAFGGGYVMIPSLIQQSEARNWATASELTNVIALAGMSPGPVAINAAVGYGYKVAGIPGTVASFLGIAVPCGVIVILAATFFFKVYQHPMVKAALYGLRPTITGIILYAAASLAVKNGMVAATSQTLIEKGINLSLGGFQLFDLKSILLAAAAFIILIRTKIHPVFVILASGALGMILF